MLPLPSVITVAKYGFLTMVMTSAGFLIGNVVVMRHQKAQLSDELVYKPHVYLPLEDADSILDRDFNQCLTEPTKTFCLTSANETLRLLGERERPDPRRTADIDLNKTTAKLDHRHPIHLLLDDFSDVMTSLDVQPVLLEPSMLFCVLSPSNKFNLLLTREFNPNHLQGSRQVVTVGLFEKDATILDREEFQTKVSNAGFEVSRIQRLLINAGLGSEDLYSVHFFFSHHSVIIHAVVLFERDAYLWHDGLSPDEFRFPDLLFVKSEIYENFTALPLNVDVDPRMKLTLPSDPVHFLFQIANSEFLHCHPQVAVPPHEVPRHPSLTGDQLLNRAVIAIQELKATLLPHFVRLCLWTESLRGWFEACNIFHRTHELNLAASYDSIKSLNFSGLWANSDYLEILDHSLLEGMDLKVSLNCHGLRINIFIFHVEDDVVWQYGNAEAISVSDAHRFAYPKFRFCATDVMGQKMYVPCETELILKAEEGYSEIQAKENVLSLS